MNWIHTPSELEQLVAGPAPGRVFIDTEYDNQNRFQPQLALVQLAWDGGEALVDPLELSLAPLSGWADEWISHDGTHDWWLLDDATCSPPHACLDTQIAARLLGYERVGLAAVCEQLLGVELDKSQQRSDWLHRPLSEEQRSYAMGDVIYLQQATVFLEEQLAARGLTQAWVEESAVVLQRALDLGQRHPKPFHRIKNLRATGPRAYGRAQTILNWRFEKARARDLPEFRVMHDAVVLKLAKATTPPREQDLKILLQHAQPLEWPQRTRLSDAAKKREKKIKVWRQTKAEQLPMEPSMLLPPALVTALAVGSSPAALPALQGWRQLWVDELVALLS
jgi:ribonuclease D